MGRKTLFNLLAVLTIVLAVGFLYYPTLNGFFQQDEWNGFAWFILNQKSSLIDTLKFFFAPNTGHYNPFAVGIQYLIYHFWGLDYTKYATLGVILHAGVAVSVYFLANKILKGNILYSFVAALLFGIFAAPFQATAWEVVNVATLGAALLGVISSILFFTYLDRHQLKFLVWSLVYLVLSLLFKETTIGLFVIFFVLARSRRKLILSFGLGYFLFRASMYLVPTVSPGGVMGQPVETIIYNFLTVPFKAISQIIIPPNFLKALSLVLAELFSQNITGIPGSPEFEAFSVRIILEILSIALGLIVVTFAFLKKSKQRLFLGVGWAIVNSLVFSFAPGTRESVSIVDSRNLYFISIGIAIFIVSLFSQISGGNLKYFSTLIVIAVLLNLYWLKVNLSEFVAAGVVRKNILQKIINDYPNLPQRIIFYMASDISYYGLPESTKILPFQSGLGQTLLVWYYKTENFPKDFFKDSFLWEIEAQGYKEFGSRGFGYFRELDLLKETQTRYNIDENSIISYSWEGRIQKLEKIH